MCRKPGSQTPGVPATPEPSTTHNCESSRAPKKSANNGKNRMAHQAELSCRPCLSHVRQEPQITQEFQRLLRLPLSERVDQTEDGTHKHHVRHSATRRSQSHPVSQARMAYQRKVRTRQHHTRLPATRRNQAHFMSPSTNSAPGRRPHWSEPLLPQTAICTFQVIHAAVRTARAPRLRFVPHHKLHPSPCCRQCHNQRRQQSGGSTATSSRTDLAANQSAPRHHHWHRPTQKEPFGKRSAWMSWGADKAPH